MRVGLRFLVGAAAVLAAGVVIVVAVNPRPGPSTGTGRSDRGQDEAQAVKLLASQGTTFIPATASDHAAPGLAAAPKLDKPGTFGGAPPRALADAKVYLGRLREVNGPNLGPRGGWAVLERHFSTPNQSKPRDRLAYLAEIRDVPACSVEISCPSLGGPGPRPLEAYFSYIDAKTGQTLGGLGLPKGYSRQHGPDGDGGGPPHARFDDGQLSFSYPSSWQKLNPRASSSFSIPLVDVSTERLHFPCSHPRPGLLSCGLPVDRLPGDGVLVTWANIAMPALHLGDAPGLPTTVDGRPARISRSAARCTGLDAGEGRTATIKPERGNSFFEMTACIGGDDGGAGARAVDQLIDSVRIAR